MRPMTAGAFASACKAPYSAIKAFLLSCADYVIFDEAQQFGDATDAWLVSLASNTRLMFVFIGDQNSQLGPETPPSSKDFCKSNPPSCREYVPHNSSQNHHKRILPTCKCATRMDKSSQSTSLLLHWLSPF